MSDRISNFSQPIITHNMDVGNTQAQSRPAQTVIPSATDNQGGVPNLSGGPVLSVPAPIGLDKLKSMSPDALMMMLEEDQRKNNFVSSKENVLASAEMRKRKMENLGKMILIQAAVLDSVDKNGHVRFDKLKQAMINAIGIATDGKVAATPHSFKELIQNWKLERILSTACDRAMYSDGRLLKQDLLNGQLKDALVEYCGLDEQTADMVTGVIVGVGTAACAIEQYIDKRAEQEPWKISDLFFGGHRRRVTANVLNEMKAGLGNQLIQLSQAWEKNDKFLKQLYAQQALFNQAVDELKKHVEEIKDGVKEAAGASKDAGKSGDNTDPASTQPVMTGGAETPA